MPRYAVDFIADIGVLEFNDFSGLSGNCKENSCQTDIVSTNNAYQTGMGNIQCLVSCTDQAHERKVLVSRGIQCGKSKVCKRVRRLSVGTLEKDKVECSSKQGDIPVVPIRPSANGSNVQNNKDNIYNENSQQPRYASRANVEPPPPHIKDEYLKRKREMLLSKLQLIENGEEADVDSLSDTLSNLDVKAELQRHLSESYQQRLQDSHIVSDVNIDNIEDSDYIMNKQMDFSPDNQSNERGDVMLDNLNSENVFGSNFSESPVKGNHSFSKIPVTSKVSSKKLERQGINDRNYFSTIGEKNLVRNEKQKTKLAAQADERSLMNMMDPHNEYLATKSIKVAQNEYKVFSGDVVESQPIFERPPVHPFSRPQTPLNRFRNSDQRDYASNDNFAWNPSSPSDCHMNRASSFGKSLDLHRSSSINCSRNNIFPGDSVIPESQTISPAADTFAQSHPEQPDENCSYGTGIGNRFQDNNIVNSSTLGKSQFMRGKAISQKFYVPESANIEKILSDQSDRRIKAICDRHHCDIEVYSRAPRSGFMKNVMILTAPSQEALKKCVRSLDCSFKWCISSQLK